MENQKIKACIPCQIMSAIILLGIIGFIIYVASKIFF